MGTFTETYPSAQGLKLSETKGASDLAYKAKVGEQYVFPDGKIWEIIELMQYSSGFRAIVLKPENDNRVVLAYKGTDLGNTPQDLVVDLLQEHGFVPNQYNEASMESARLKKKFGNNVILTGHSLGGGLATYSSLVNKIPATTINPAPLAEKPVLRFGSMNQCYAWITNYITNGREFITGDGVNLTIGYIAFGLSTGLGLLGTIVLLNPNVPKPDLPKPKLVVIGNRISISGGGKPLGYNYYFDHMISDSAPEVPLPKIIGKMLNSMSPIFPTPVPVPAPTPNPVSTPTSTPTSR